MRALLTWLVEGIPFSVRSRRAIDETLADWEIEEHEPATSVDRAVINVRGVLAIARVAAIAIARETGDFGWCRGLGRRLGVVVGVAFLFVLLLMTPVLDEFGPRVLDLAVTILPVMLFAVAPPAIFLMLAWRPVNDKAPGIGAAVWVTLATLALGVWIVPTASELFGNIASAGLELGNPAPPTRDRPASTPVTGFAALTGAAVLLAAAMAKRSRLESRWWLAGVPVIYFVSTTVLRFAIGLPLLLIFHMGDRYPLGAQLSTWAGVFLTLAAAVTLMPRAVRAATPATD